MLRINAHPALRAALLTLVAAWAFVALPSLARLARAETGNPAIDAGIAQYNDLEYELAVQTLTAALAQQGLTVAELTEGYKHLGLSLVAIGQDDSAREAFKKLIESAPTFELPRTENPRALDLFAEVKRSLKRASAKITLSTSPVRPRNGAAIDVSAVVDDADATVTRVVVHHRVRGQRSYSSVIALPAADGRYDARIPGTFVLPPGVEYYVTAEGDDGHVFGQQGSADSPLMVAVEAADGGTPIYGKWWFWAGLGGLALASAAVVLVLAGGGGDNPPDGADITITVDGL
jgi:tetratricopeptide (TPR) repeat protein